MRALYLGVILTIVGGALFFYELGHVDWLYWGETEWLVVVAGFVILFIGLWVLVTKFKQWVLGH